MRNTLKYLLTVILAATFLWFAFKNADMSRLFYYAKSIKLYFLPLIALSGITSHLLRAKRWIILLSPLKQSISLWNSFCAVMIGYAVNIVLPRGGEVARLIAISKEENLPWAGVLPTMLIDRLIDIAMLSIMLGIALFQLPDSFTATVPWLKSSGMALIALSIVGLIILPFVAAILKAVVPKTESSSFAAKIHELAEQFEIGTRSLRNPAMFPVIAVLSLCMWFCYWLNLQLLIFAFGLEKTISLTQSLQVFAISSFGVLIPTPASVGGYHLLLSRSLMLLCGVNQDLSLAFATVAHLLSFITVTCIVAAFCVLVNVFSKKRSSN